MGVNYHQLSLFCRRVSRPVSRSVYAGIGFCARALSTHERGTRSLSDSERNLVDALASLVGPDSELVTQISGRQEREIIPNVVFDHTLGVKRWRPTVRP
jgi:hypothetical protein